jgi:hypothetical protein
MDSYDEDLAELNKDKIEMIIDGFLQNLRLLGNLTSNIANIAILNDMNDPEGTLISEDERKCSARENEERLEYVNKQINGRTVSNYILNEIKNEAVEKIHKLRFREIIAKLESYIRLSHILDEGSYDWPKFFNNESDEPSNETLIRQAFTNEEKRIEYRHVTLCKFIQYSFPYWERIKSKDISFLVNHLSTIFPNSDFTDKLEIIYGNNDLNKKYISDENLNRVWMIIHGCIKTSIKYLKYIGRTTFKNKVIRDGVEIVDDLITINVDDQIVHWNVNWQEVRPVIKR